MTLPPQDAHHIHWIFADHAPDSARDLLQSGNWVRQAEQIKANRRRTIHRVPGNPPLIVKQDIPPRFVDRVKALWRKAGMREYRAVTNLHQAGLPVPAPIAYAVHGLQSFCAIEELQNCRKLRLAWEQSQADPQQREKLLQAVTAFAMHFVRARVVHPDMHTGNILVQETAEGATCYLVDLAGAVRVGPASNRSAWQALGWLSHLSPTLSHAEACKIIKATDLVCGGPPLNLWKSLIRRKAHEDAKRWPGRKRRLLGNSSLCAKQRTKDGTWHLMRPFPITDAEALLAQHRQNVHNNALLKSDRKRRLSRCALNDQQFVVKEFREPGRGPWRADRRSWFCHYRMNPDELPTCRCHAWFQKPQRGYLVLEDVGENNLQRVLEDASPATRRRLLMAAGKILAWLHLRGIWHRDTKATNLIVGDLRKDMPLTWVDCDAVRFDVAITPDQRARNLAQLIENLPNNVHRKEVLRCAVAYRREAGLQTQQFRALLETILPDS